MIGSQSRNQDFVQDGANWRGPKVPRTKNRKLLGFSLPFLGPVQFVFYFLIITIKFYFSVQGEA